MSTPLWKCHIKLFVFFNEKYRSFPQKIMWMGKFWHFFSIYSMHKFAHFHKNKIPARVVLEMAVFPALSSVILILLIGKLHSFHRWSWFLRWCSKFPLIIMVKLKTNENDLFAPNSKSFDFKNEIFVVMKLLSGWNTSFQDNLKPSGSLAW